MIKYIIEVNKWFDKVNGNTYHSVDITQVKNNKLIVSSGLTYGYDEQYKTTSYDELIKLRLVKEKDRHNHDLNRKRFKFVVNENALKRDLKKVEVEK